MAFLLISKRLLTTTEQPYHIQQAASAFPSSPSIFHLDLIPLSATAAMPKILRHYFADNQRATPPAEDFLFFSFFAIPKPYPSPTQAQRCCLGLGRAWVWRRKACFGTWWIFFIFSWRFHKKFVILQTSTKSHRKKYRRQTSSVANIVTLHL